QQTGQCGAQRDHADDQTQGGHEADPHPGRPYLDRDGVARRGGTRPSDATVILGDDTVIVHIFDGLELRGVLVRRPGTPPGQDPTPFPVPPPVTCCISWSLPPLAAPYAGRGQSPGPTPPLGLQGTARSAQPYRLSCTDSAAATRARSGPAGAHRDGTAGHGCGGHRGRPGGRP